MKSKKYIDGNLFKSLCYLQYDEYGLNKNEFGYENFIFVKTEMVKDFIRKHHINYDFTLITHNSDFPVDGSYLEILNHSGLLSWYAQNLDFEHPKLLPIPIGLANDKWEHGNKDVFNSVVNQNNEKTILCYANFEPGSNPSKRLYAMGNTPPEYLYPRVDFKTYAEQLSRSLFCFSPEGNGIDCHRTWESLYLKAIPIVKSSILTLKLKEVGFPMILIEDYSELKKLELSRELYDEIFVDVDINKIFLSDFGLY